MDSERVEVSRGEDYNKEYEERLRKIQKQRGKRRKNPFVHDCKSRGKRPIGLSPVICGACMMPR